MNEIGNRIQRRRIIAGVIALPLLLFLFSFAGSYPVLHLFGLTTITAEVLLASRLLYWLAAGLVWLYANNAEKQNLLLRQEQSYPFPRFAASVVVILLILFGGSVIIGFLLLALKLNQTSSKLLLLARIFQQHTSLLFFTSLTAGVTEELLFRGYMQTRFEQLFRHPYVAITLSSLLFGLLHFRYGTVANVLVPFFIGFVFAVYYWKYRNIKVLMICHFLWDVMASYLLIMRYGTK